MNRSGSFPRKILHVKTIISAALIAVVLLHFLSSLPALYRSYEAYQRAKRVDYLNDVSDHLFTAVANYGFERGRVNVVLNDAGPVANMEKNRRFISSRRSDGDVALAAALSKLATTDLPEVQPQINRIRLFKQKIEKLRRQAASDLIITKGKRDRNLPEIWFSAMTEYIECIEALLVSISIDISDADGMISRYSSLKHEILALRNTAGPEMSILSATMLSGKPIKPQLGKKIEKLQNSTQHHFKNLEFLSQKLPGSQIPDALKTLEKVYSIDYLPYRRAVVPYTITGDGYPYSQPEFLGQGIKALKQMAEFMKVVVNVTKEYAENQLNKSKHQIFIQLFSAMGSLALIVLIFFYLHNRVIRPIGKLTSSVRRLARKDLNIEVPFRDAQDEIGEMARAVAVFKGMAIKLEEDMVALQVAEEKIRNSEERFRTVADFAYDWEYWIDPNGRLKYISPSCLRITGYTPEEFLKDPHLLAAICVPEDRDIFNNHVNGDNMAREPSASIDFRIHHKNGGTRWINHICQPIVSRDGDFLGRRACNRDISDRKRLEEDLIKAKKLEATATLAGGIAHDFNNLIAAVLGNVELAEESIDAKDPAQKFLKSARMASLRAGNLTSKFITFSSGGAPVREPVNINEFIRDSAALCATGTNLRLEFNLPPEPWRVLIDIAQFTQAVNNIIANAREAMPEGGTLTISVENVKAIDLDKDLLTLLPEKHYVRITFKDQGSGIPQEIIEKVFDPYFSTKERGVNKGMGLGLTVVHSIVGKHKGHISIQAQKEGGTSVCLYLPATVRETKEISAPEKRAGSKGEMGQGKKVLIMDDEEIIRDFVSEILGRQGYDCEHAKDGLEAVDKFQWAANSGDPFHFVIMDLTIPGGMGGEKAVREVLKIDSAAKVIVASGYSADPILENFSAHGFCGAISKPFRRDVLLDVIMKIDQVRS
jgi:PAS domain S-box-containing protein